MIGTATMAAPAYTTMAAPAYGGSYAAPVTYAAAPAYGATYGAPMTTGTASYVAQPQMMAQPQMTYAAAAPSYVAAPQMIASAIVAGGAPVAPPKLTEGIPTPEQIAAQKAQYAKALDKQLQDAISTVQKETQIEKDMAKFTADKTIALFNNQCEERLAEGLALADEQATIATLELKKALVERNLQLSAQAQNLTMDYNMKALQQECAKKRYDFEVKYLQEEGKLEQKYAEQARIANVAY